MPDVSFALSDDDIRRIASEVVIQLRDELQQSASTNGDAGKLLNEGQAAKLIGVHRDTLKRWRLAERVKPFRATKPVRYRLRDIEAIKKSKSK